MEILFAVITALLVSAIAVMSWHCGRLKQREESLRFEVVRLSAQLWMERASETQRQGLGVDFQEEEWPDEI
jgi:hypothetical protein